MEVSLEDGIGSVDKGSNSLASYPESQSPLPPDADYTVLSQLAKRRNLKIKDVPGDGNCFFHAVSVSLPAIGVQALTGPQIRASLIDYLEATDFKADYSGFLQLPSSDCLSPSCNALSQQQHQEFQQYISALRNGEWADNVAIQAVCDMLNINIEVINTITSDWMHDIHPRQGRSTKTITIGQLGEQHYVAFQNNEDEITQQLLVEVKQKQQFGG